MYFRQILAIGLLTAVAATAHSSEEAKKDPKTGKNCVTFFSSGLTSTGREIMNFRNICSTPFQIRIAVGESVRETAIESGSPEKPSKASITCKADESCVAARWKYE